MQTTHLTLYIFNSLSLMLTLKTLIISLCLKKVVHQKKKKKIFVRVSKVNLTKKSIEFSLKKRSKMENQENKTNEESQVAETPETNETAEKKESPEKKVTPEKKILDLYYVPASGPCRAVQMGAKAVGVELNLKYVNLLAKDQLKPDFIKVKTINYL